MFVWALYAIFVALLLGLAALAAEHVARLRGQATRWVWVGALLASLLLPPAMSFLAVDLPTQLTPLEPGLLRLRETTARALSPERWLIAAVGAGFEDLNAWSVRLWPYGSALFVTLLLALSGYWIRRRRTLPVIELDGIRVHVAPDVGPAVIGFLRPHIVLPGWLLQSEPALCATALAHERQHITARDPQLLFASIALACAMPWNLPLWWMTSRLRRAIEVDCDARMVRAGHDARDYGALLLAVNQGQPALALSAVSLTESHSFLETRIRLMLAMRHSGWRWSLVIAAVAGTLALLVSVQVRPPELASRREIPFDAHSVAGLVGYYHFGGLSVLHVARAENRLYATLTGQERWELRARSDYEYFAAARDATLSFVTDRDGRGVRVHMQYGGERYAARRMRDVVAQDLLRAFADKIRNQTPSAGTQAALTRILTDLEAGRPDYASMSRFAAESIRDSLGSLQIELRSYGPRRAVSFAGVTPQGLDVYRIEYPRGLLRGEVKLAADGKVLRFELGTWVADEVIDARTRRFQTQTAAAGSERALRDFIAAMRTGTPDYDTMVAGLAAIVRQQAWTIQVGLASLGALQSITFDRVTPNGADTYSVRFERGVIVCQILLMSDGKIQGLFWDP